MFQLVKGNLSMKKKLEKLICYILWSVFSGLIIQICRNNDYPIVACLASAILSLILVKIGFSAQDLLDNNDWKTSQRRLKRGGFIKDDTIIRISFAYLYRIKIGDKYLLVRNARNTGKYQPVGGVYKLKGNEKMKLKNMFHVMDDDKIPIDESSRDDYRLRMESRFLRDFVKRFDSKKSERERICDVGREFKEELIETGILNWNRITYRFCGRHMTELKFEEHFQIYELLLADVVELLPTKEQEADLRRLMEMQPSNKYRFATASQIACLGIDTTAGQLHEWVSDHSPKILQENEGALMKPTCVGEVYTIDL